MSEIDYATRLRRFLIDLPRNSDYTLTEDVKVAIRKSLFLALSRDGDYVEWVFPKVFENTLDKLAGLDSLEKEVNWLFPNYYSIRSRGRDPTYNAHNHHAFHSSLPCARIFRKGEPIYRCLTCGYDETCALCPYCFQPENHEDHAVHIMICQRENGGVCDCGDPEAWVKPVKCKYATQEDPMGNNLPPMIPPGFLESFLQTIEILLDYVIDVMCQSDLQICASWDRSEPIENSATCRLDPRKYGYPDETDANYDAPGDKFCLLAYNDQIRHFRDAVQRIHLASKKVPEFATMVAEKMQSHGRARVIRSKDVNLLFERQKILSATGLASCIRNTRDEFREDTCHEILQWIGDLTESEIFKFNEEFKNLFSQAFCRKWRKGLVLETSEEIGKYCRGRLDNGFLIPKINLISTHPSNRPYWAFQPSQWQVDEHLKEICDFNTNRNLHEDYRSYLGSRFQYVVYMDMRFWKSIRGVIHDVFLTSVITNLKFKPIIGCQYVDIYPAVADMFLTVDSEPELNVMCTLSTQLFTCPSNSTNLIAHGDVSRVFAAIYAFLRTGLTNTIPSIGFENNSVLLPSLKNRRWGQIFFDIGYILSRGKDVNNTFMKTLIPMACDMLCLFQGRPVMSRETENHVEYESSDYTAFFHAILVIYQYADNLAHCLTDNNLGQNKRSVELVIVYVIQYLLALESSDGRAHSDYNEVDYGRGISLGVGIDRLTNSRKVSFLHPMHSFLSWLIESLGGNSDCSLLNIFRFAANEARSQSPTLGTTNECIRMIFEYPLKAVVLSSQIKSGYWVRNGFSVRSQLQLYTNTALREQGYLRDMFLVQVYLVCSEPDQIANFLLRSWRLDGVWKDSPDGEMPYETNILSYLLEEFLSFFIHILTDDTYLTGADKVSTNCSKIKNEILHNICFGPLSYSRLCTQIPEHITTNKRFDLILEELAIVKSRKCGKDTCTYALKEEFMDEINPYYFNYSTNKKDEALKFVKERTHRKTSKNISEVVIYPKVLDPDRVGTYKTIGNVTTSSAFADFIIQTVDYIFLEDVHKLDGLLETVLHLIHVCVSQKTVDFEKYGKPFTAFCKKSEVFGSSVVGRLHDMLLNDTLKEHHAKIRAILKPASVTEEELVEILSDCIPSFNPKVLHLVREEEVCESEVERKKRVALERQNKLMAKFKKQQSLFLKKNNFSTENSDTEMEEIEEEGWQFPNAHCILCQDTAEDAGPFGIVAHIFKSTEFRSVPFDDDYWFVQSFSDSPNLNFSSARKDNPDNYSQRWTEYMKKIEEDHVVGPGFRNHEHITAKLTSLTCGHGMHFNCYMQYLNSNRSRLTQITRNTPESPEHREFLCPLCKALSNMFIPILWTANNRSLTDFLTKSEQTVSPFEEISIPNVNEHDELKKLSLEMATELGNFSLLTPAALELIGPNCESQNSQIQQQFRMMLSTMFQNLSLLSFPQIFKADLPLILVNSIKSTEISLRGMGTGEIVPFQMSNNALLNLRALNEFRLTSMLMKVSNWVKMPNNLGDVHVKIAALFLSMSDDNFNSKIAHEDFLEVLVTLFPLSSGGFGFNTILERCYLGTVIQAFSMIVNAVVTRRFYENDSFDILDVPCSELIDAGDAINITKLFKVVADTDLSRYQNYLSDPKFGQVLYLMLMKAINPFLRRASIYAFVCCANTEGVDFETPSEKLFEANALCNFLNLRPLGAVLERACEETSSMEARCLKSFVHFARKNKPKQQSDGLVLTRQLEFPGVVRLARIPERLDFFFSNYYYLDKYHKPHLTIENPAVCLFCSDILDIQKSVIGSKFGQCTTHYREECSSSVGIFLLPKERSILLLHNNGGSFHDAPYLDKHGEIPGENKRGKTAYLSLDRLEDITRNLWLQHNVLNYVVRKLDSVIDAGGWETL